jgi:hypothetical protein
LVSLLWFYDDSGILGALDTIARKPQHDKAAGGLARGRSDRHCLI